MKEIALLIFIFLILIIIIGSSKKSNKNNSKKTSDSNNKQQTKSNNPKYHRSSHEKELADNFYVRNFNKIEKLEDSIMYYNFNKSLYNSAKKPHINIETQISNLETSLIALNTLREFCYSKGKGGKLYFDDMYEHCHNSKNPNFSIRDRLIEDLDYAKENKDTFSELDTSIRKINSDILPLIKKNKGILLSDIQSQYPPELKRYISSKTQYLEKGGFLSREKIGKSYSLSAL